MKEGGAIAGDARKALEAKSGKPVVSKENYLIPPVAAALENAGAATPHAKRKAVNRPKKAVKARRNGLELVQIVRPLLHHLPAFGEVRGAVVCAPVRIAHGMGKLVFDEVRALLPESVRRR